MKHLSHALAALGVAGLLGYGAAPAQAAVFSYSSTCGEFMGGLLGECSFIGLAMGAAVSGTITFADAAVTPNGPLSKADVLDFSFTFGDVAISYASAVAYDVTAELNAAADGFITFNFRAAEAIDPEGDGTEFGDAVSFSLVFWSAALTGSCADDICSNAVTLGPLSISVTSLLTVPHGAAVFERLASNPTPTPEPGSLSALCLGLAGAGLLLRRRREGAR